MGPGFFFPLDSPTQPGSVIVPRVVTAPHPQPDGPPEPARLTDYVDGETLQELQDNFTSFARLKTQILDAQGQPLTRPTNPSRQIASERALQQLLESEQDDRGVLQAPIVVGGRELGSIVVEPEQIAPHDALNDADHDRLEALCDRLGLAGADRSELYALAEDAYATKVGASIQFLYLIANSVARLCYEQHQNRLRVEELEALYDVSTALAGQRQLTPILETAARAVERVLSVRGVVIRLLRQHADQQELQAACVHGITAGLADKGKTLVNKSELSHKALAGEMVYIADMTADPRSFYPEDCAREGVVSMLSTGLRYQDTGIGTIQLFTRSPRTFTSFEKNLTRAIAQLLAAAIHNAQLDEEQRRSRQILRQVRLARDVQRRMLPHREPNVPGYDIAGAYVPCYDLGGDFYDYINLNGSLGLAMGDVVGKGVAASLLMAHARASLRAYAQDLYDLDVVMQRVNHAMTRDTRDNEFATLWYGTLEPRSGRLTYCNAGHEPGLLLRGSEIIPLDAGGMVVGVLSPTSYEKGVIDLKPGDTLLLHSDGLPDAMDTDDQRLGKARVHQLLRETVGKSAKDAVADILHAVQRHQGTRPAADDTTVVLVKAG